MAEFSSHPLGHVFETDRVLVFFGDRRSTHEAVLDEFAPLRAQTLRQVHSNIVIASPHAEPGPEADAHFTRDEGLAICIRTADCTPVMIHDPESGLIASIHAGWRGVENEIVLKTCERLKTEGATLRAARAWIGPHIRTSSFEVGADVAASLERTFSRVATHSPEPTSLRPHDDPAKARVDLLTIVRAQLCSMGISAERTHEHTIDTFTSPAHESHRRDRERAGRQISFIALKL
jgi:hypothetical protein